jgi:geranylgeranyl reductase family protein
LPCGPPAAKSAPSLGRVIDADVVVVGGGPAGSAAAITLARAGRHVVLVDKARFPRDKCCGDGLTTGALRTLEHLGLAPAAVPSWQVVDAAWVRSPSGRVVAFPFPAGRGQYGAVAPRLELDAALLVCARAAGVKVYDGHALTGAVQHGDDVVVDVDGLGPLRARYAVGADGMWSPLRKHLGLAEPGYLGEWHAFRQYASSVSGTARDRLWVWFEPDLLPGYAWSFPLPDGRVNVGFGILRGDGRRTRDMKAQWEDLLTRPHVRQALGPQAQREGTHKAWPIPARVDRAVLGAGRTLLVGDAASATDPMTGEGIAQALDGGVAAGEAIVAAGALAPEVAQRAYARAMARTLIPDHRMSTVLQRALRTPLGARGAVRVAGLTPWTRRNFGRWLFEDEPRAVVVTPSRWHRHFLDRDGAYP